MGKLTLEEKRSKIRQIEEEQKQANDKFSEAQKLLGIKYKLISGITPPEGSPFYSGGEDGSVTIRQDGFVQIEVWRPVSHGYLDLTDHQGKQLVKILAEIYGMKIEESPNQKDGLGRKA